LKGKELFSLDFKTGVRSVEFALGDRMFLVLTDSRSNIPATLSVYKLTNAGTCESQTPLQSIVIPGSAARVARWGALNKFILIGHEDGTITSWEPLVR
jgi:translation initiation factor 3 subunit I